MFIGLSFPSVTRARHAASCYYQSGWSYSIARLSLLCSNQIALREITPAHSSPTGDCETAKAGTRAAPRRFVSLDWLDGVQTAVLSFSARIYAGRRGKSRLGLFGHITISTSTFADLYFLAVRGIKHYPPQRKDGNMANGFLFPIPLSGAQSLQAAINQQLAPAGTTITRQEACQLARHREQCLFEAERIEFGTPAVALIARELAESNALSNANVASTLAALQDCFYQARDELPADVPDGEIIEALIGCFIEQGDATDVAKTSAEEIMSNSRSYRQAQIEAEQSSYRITDGEGRVYTFEPKEWEYDETAPGWNGEKWASDWNE